jgi:hypothetical protein
MLIKSQTVPTLTEQRMFIHELRVFTKPELNSNPEKTFVRVVYERRLFKKVNVLVVLGLFNCDDVAKSGKSSSR